MQHLSTSEEGKIFTEGLRATGITPVLQSTLTLTNL